MKIPNWLKGALLDTADTIMAATPRRKPAVEQLRDMKLIAHRGSHRQHIENTLSAFQHAIELGAWGIEFDIRWTNCGQTVVHHDPHGERVFKKPCVVADSSFSSLRSQIPLIPMLEEVVELARGRAHMMIEIKGASNQISKAHWQALKEALSNLEPARDYHLMSLDQEILRAPPIAPNEAWLPIAELNISSLSLLAEERGLGGVTGQYLFVNNNMIQHHKRLGQNVGTGFVNSRSVLYREVARGVEWIFSDEVEAMLKIRNENL